MNHPEAIYTDGGLCGRNPSPLGGSWAWCFVDEGVRVRSQSGCFSPADVRVQLVTNNVTELFAAVAALQEAPQGWAGRLYTDSRVTQMRVAKTKRQAALNGIPQWLRQCLEVEKQRLGGYTVALLGGHPTKRDIARGKRRDGSPVSIHNVFVDRLCKEAAARMRRELEKAAGSLRGEPG